MKPALLVLGGITYKNYAIGDLLSMPETKNYLNGEGNLDTEYSHIKELDCEQFLDNKTIDFLGRLMVLGIPFRLWDRFGDYFKIIGNKKTMKRVSEYVVHEVELANKLYGQVDLIAHSLGTLIALASDIKVRNLYLLGSPLTSQFWSIRHTANDFIQKNGLEAEAQKVQYCYSPLDIVGTRAIEANFENINCYPSSHDFSDYMRILLKERVIKL